MSVGSACFGCWGNLFERSRRCVWRVPGQQLLSSTELGKGMLAAQGGGDGEHPFGLLHYSISQEPLTGR